MSERRAFSLGTGKPWPDPGATPMTPTNTLRATLDELRALSEAATPGPWGNDRGYFYGEHPVGQCPYRNGIADATFIVAAVNYVRAALQGDADAPVGGLREYDPCEMTHARGTTHYHPLRVSRAIKEWGANRLAATTSSAAASLPVAEEET